MMLCSEAVSYAGDVTPEEAWKVLSKDPESQLIDVRSAFEWSLFGTPDLDDISKKTIMVEWNSYPPFARNIMFVPQLEAKLNKIGKDIPLYFLCRSGWRSSLAAAEMSKKGYKNCYNVAYGFEGSEETRSARSAGWKESGLPWKLEMETCAA